jgi:hypothetical protein
MAGESSVKDNEREAGGGDGEVEGGVRFREDRSKALVDLAGGDFSVGVEARFRAVRSKELEDLTGGELD